MARGLLQEHHRGPTANLNNVQSQFHVYESENLILKDRKPDNCSYGDLYSYPIESCKLEVHEVWDLLEHIEVYMLSDQMFCVMDFLQWFYEDDKNTGAESMRETAIVPEIWLTPQKGRSYWPPQFKDSMLKMPVNSSWPKYEVEIRGTYDSYRNARMKLSRAVETDNFESAPESHGRNKRKKKVPKRLDDSSSESDTRCLVSSPPKIYQKENKKKVKNSISMDSWSKQKFTTTERIQDNSYHLQSLSCQQSYLFNGVKRSLQEIIKNQQEIKAKLRNHDTMLENVLMLVANDSEQLTKP
ncbi:uncharacterized protein LOC112590592 [Harpegnathos saltator]|uniref:uncharacterized protein LOC112590592 n=1 Tax=Harpegnathos saltator TaxID=610380 RepID=UPI000DBEF0D3|nr:uncharacterized protein LOC112590592 [Harpegnathos saltator]